MNDSKISVRYVKALFELALEKGSLLEVKNNLVLLSEAANIADYKE